ncbi:hypothetical protein [Floridanema evergladense]|uniref:LAGLIDADG homing endonuclease n=1 Tax=Floridaenema evergladense BLCC-F167 TaxID=3153639 RepID=A0ABV4WIF5_9CYAN
MGIATKGLNLSYQCNEQDLQPLWQWLINYQGIVLSCGIRVSSQ